MFKKGVKFANLVDPGDLAVTDTDFIIRNNKTYSTVQSSRIRLARKTPAGSRSVTLPAVLTNTDNDKIIVITGGSGSLSIDPSITDGFGCLVINKSGVNAVFSTTTGIITELAGLLAIPNNGFANVFMAASSMSAISSS